MNIKLQKQNFIEESSYRLKQDLYEENRQPSKTLLKKPQFSFEQRAKIVIEGQSNWKSINQICERERISLSTFNKWTEDFLTNGNLKPSSKDSIDKEFSFEKRFSIVVEGKSGKSSIPQICRREQINQETFLKWNQEFLEIGKQKVRHLKENRSNYIKNQLLFGKSSNIEAFNYLENYIDFKKSRNLVLLKSDSVKLDLDSSVDNIVVLEKINDIRYINKFFEKINSRLEKDSIFAGCLETFSERKKRKKINYIPIVNKIYFGLEFLIKRILPKLSFTKKYYFDFTKGSDRLLSKAEGLGRLVSCGFKIMDYKTIDGLLYFVVKKERMPYFDMAPSYGPLYKMKRIGKNGKIIGVYKFRTMHPYSEYLQDYIINAHGYANTGKPANDFRIPVWGKFMRRLWLDELPQLINVLKGELKLVGVRPVSERYFQDIPKEMQKLRMTQKPGCIPPYVSLNRAGNVMSVLNAEKEYLEEKIKNPMFTDTKYFFLALFNILFKHKRSA